jgi:hypothetical protein
VRLPLQNDSRLRGRWWLEVGFANMQFADLFTPSPAGNGFVVKESGALRPPDSRDVPYPRIVCSLTIPEQSRQTIYLRFESGASMAIPLTFRTLT